MFLGQLDETEGPRGSGFFRRGRLFPPTICAGGSGRMAARTLFDALLARGEQISLDAYHGMTCGAVTGSPSGRLTFEESVQASGHPFLGLFGGGPRLVRSALQVSTGWPILASTIQAGVLSEDLQPEVPCPLGNEWLLTQRLFFRRIDDAIRFTDGHAQTVVKDFGPEVTRWIESVSTVKKARESASTKKMKPKPARKADASGPAFGIKRRCRRGKGAGNAASATWITHASNLPAPHRTNNSLTQQLLSAEIYDLLRLATLLKAKHLTVMVRGGG